MAAQESSIAGLADDLELAALTQTPQESWADFDETVRCNLGISAEEFIRRVGAGEIVNDDRDSGVTFLFMLLDGVPEEMRGRQGDASTPGAYHEGRRQAMAAEPSSTATVDGDVDLAALLESDEDYWAGFDAAVRRKLGISGDEFIAKVRAGEIVDDDLDAGITHLFMRLRGVPARKLRA
jgi:hypothetical protein